MLRNLVLGVANRRSVRSAATGGLGWKVARRFVAGERLSDAVSVIRLLNAAGVEASIDYLGENVADLTQAESARDTYVRALEWIAREALKAEVSVKLTQMGLDVDPAVASANADDVVAAAGRAGTFVTLDMEDHRYTDRTIDACETLAAAHPDRVGIAIQAYLRRTPEDLERLGGSPVRIRLCKGAYNEPGAIAYRRSKDVDDAFARLTTQLLTSSLYAMIATHDDALIEHAAREADRLGRARETYEFQMLFGVRRELQRELVSRGLPLRVYVPFGEQWYPYLTRRIAERPANVRFFAEALVRG